MTQVHGWTARGWEGVRDAFLANVDSGAEVGAAYSTYHRGQKVVDRGQAWPIRPRGGRGRRTRSCRSNT